MDATESRIPVARSADLLAYCAVILTALVGNANVSLKPVLIGSYVEFLKYSASTAGYVLTAEATATSLGTAISALCINRFDRRRMVVVSLVIIVLGNFLSLHAAGPTALAAVRGFTGIGHGIALAVTAASIAGFRQPDRMAGIVTVGVSALGMSLMFFVPWAQASHGIQPLFLTMGSLVVLPLTFLHMLPSRTVDLRVGTHNSPSQERSARPQRGTILITLMAAGCFFVSVGSFWPFAEQLGRATGLNYADAVRVTAFAGMAAIFGALTAIALGDRFGRLLPIGCSISVAIAGEALLLSFPQSEAVVSVVVIAYMFCWAVLYPYLLGFTSQLDPSGRVSGFVMSLSLIGFAVGPGLASAIITIGAADGGSNLANLVWMSILCLLPSFGLLYAVSKQNAAALNDDVLLTKRPSGKIV